MNIEEALAGFKKYKIVSSGATTYAVVLSPYQPFDNYPIDNYYFASNSLYFTLKERISTLAQMGIVAKAYTGNLKKLAFDSGLVDFIGRNSLAYTYEYGSFFVLGALEIAGEYGYEILQAREIKGCCDCGKCVKACPTHAIEDDAISSRCLRAFMERGDFDDEVALLMQDRILGCNTCQIVCPHNERIAKISPDDELKVLLANIENLPLSSFDKLVGKNVARRRILGNMIANYCKRKNK